MTWSSSQRAPIPSGVTCWAKAILQRREHEDVMKSLDLVSDRLELWPWCLYFFFFSVLAFWPNASYLIFLYSSFLDGKKSIIRIPIP